MNDNEIRQAIGRYKFYHIIKLTDTIATPGNPGHVPAQNLCLKHLKSMDLKNKRVLDIGCRDGLFSLAAEAMGASEVIGIDNDLSEAATQFLIPFFKSKVKMKQINLYDFKDEAGFDIVIFPGVLYHLRYPFWGLKKIKDVLKPGGHLLIETAIWRGELDKAILFCPTGTEGPYDADSSSCTFFNEKGLVDTMNSLAFQTVRIEYLDGEGVQMHKGMKQKIKEMLKPVLAKRGFVPANNKFAVTRCVFHLVYKGYDENTWIAKYWDKTHDFHTTLGW
jgi:SAM-dependent methyltransferase